mmetsp:Transcript_5773/g.13490  ORF Transcript_5773/g.13490 Transcript_5773/m.13490 type:complete len:366 (-) Transcript_5773:30-1127(-)
MGFPDVNGYLRGNFVVRDIEDAVRGNSTAMKSIAHNMGNSSDWTLRIISRVTAAIVLLIIIAAIAVVIYIQVNKKKKSKPFRPAKTWVKVKAFLSDLFCCAFCCPGCQARIAPGYIRPRAPKALRVTLLRAEGIKKRHSFYFEVAAQPADGWPKVSRIHKKVSGVCDLAAESFELNWYGDEEGVLIQVIDHSGTIVTKDHVLGDVHIKRSAIEGYTEESRYSPNDLTAGTRVFPVKHRGLASEGARASRFSEENEAVGVLLKPVYTSIIAALQAQTGDADAVEENRVMKKELETLRAENMRLGGSASTSGTDTSARAEAETVMSVSIRFELVEPAHCDIGNYYFREAPMEDQLLAPQSCSSVTCY